MAIRLKNIRGFAPGGYPYQQPAPKPHYFKAESYDLKQQAIIVSQYRLANGLPRSSLAETMEDIDAYTCQRLGGNPRWCFDTDKGYTTAHPQLAKGGCGSCGHRH